MVGVPLLSPPFWKERKAEAPAFPLLPSFFVPKSFSILFLSLLATTTMAKEVLGAPLLPPSFSLFSS